MRRLTGIGTLLTDDLGRRTFYPYGPLGRGYLIDEQQEQLILKTLRAAWCVLISGLLGFYLALFTAIYLIDPLPSLAKFLPLPFMLATLYLYWYKRNVGRLTRNLPALHYRIGVARAMSQNAARAPWLLLLLNVAIAAYLLFNPLVELLREQDAWHAGDELKASFLTATTSLPSTAEGPRRKLPARPSRRPTIREQHRVRTLRRPGITASGAKAYYHRIP